MPDPFVVWSPDAILTALIGGATLGLLVVARFENPRFGALDTVAVTAMVAILAGFVFYAGQAVETYFADGITHAWRVVSRFGLWVLFSLAMAIGTGLSVRRHRGVWR